MNKTIIYKILIIILILYLIYIIELYLKYHKKNKLIYDYFENKDTSNIKEKIKKFENFIKNKLNLHKNITYETEENKYINNLKKLIEKYNYDIDNNNKILVLIACHIDSYNKFETLKNNIKYFKNLDICIINTSNLEFNKEVEKLCKNNNMKYMEKENDIYVDFGKWIHCLENIDYKKYDYIVFTNDSIYLTNKINYFFNLMVEKNKDLYGYNDSTELNYHYQSYLFGIKSISINKFLDLYKNNKKYIKKSKEHYSLIKNTELKLANFFDSKDCFLKISNFESNDKKNIYLKNYYLYNKLYSNNILPIIKLRQLK